jgi:hypothetical protein
MNQVDGRGLTSRERIIIKMNKLTEVSGNKKENRADLKVLTNILKVLSPESPRSLSVIKSEYHDHYPESDKLRKEGGNVIIDISKMPGYDDIVKKK